MAYALESGAYIIKSKSTEGAYIGRNIHEDKSLLPKSVLLLPKDIPDIPQWEITRSEDHTYILTTRGSHAADINGNLFGILLPQPPATKWKIEPQAHLGEHVYTITEATEGRGWISPEEIFHQVAVGPMIVFPTFPPKYPNKELFEITRDGD